MDMIALTHGYREMWHLHRFRIQRLRIMLHRAPPPPPHVQIPWLCSFLLSFDSSRGKRVTFHPSMLCAGGRYEHPPKCSVSHDPQEVRVTPFACFRAV